MTTAPEILFSIKGGIGFITLNRPEALNALNLNMIREMDLKLIEWATSPFVQAVVVAGAGDRAFCSGGDVKSVALEAKAAATGTSDGALTRHFFREEYTLNNRIYTFPKPYISLVSGIVMGGGKGLSAHGSHRVVTENTLFAMPETNIGFFPDVGGGYFLPRCPGQTGLYLALTSKRIKASDTIYIGFATHFVPHAKIPELIDALTGMAWDRRIDPKKQVDMVISLFADEAKDESELAQYRNQIDTCFAHDRVEDILADLEKDNSPWSAETQKAMHGMSPTSLKIALRQIRLGATMEFAEVMKMEYRLSQACMQGHDFYEGIRAALIDKDRQPKWQPARIVDVDDALVAHCFDQIGDRELIL